ncbi:hypothetical protein R69927_07540 [Paraburkholderia domus]|nr:hypothetical protein R69749_03972 [Paraburkholderia domus]CAE6938221.1 hypothetical protein R69927_07540 [Paraburkholderia domus]
MKKDQTKRRTHRRHGDTAVTFPAATPSIIRCALHRTGNDLRRSYAWQFTLHTLRGLFPRGDSSDQIGLHASVCTPTRPA